VAIGGGFQLTPESTAYAIASQPNSTDTGWIVGAYASTGDGDVTATAYVVCATMNLSLSSAGVESISTEEGSEPSVQKASLKCSSGGMTTGGFSITDAAAYTTMFVQSDGALDKDGVDLTQWGVTAFNNDGTSHTATEYAVCMA
jgi:hypothetical protein